MPFRFDHRAHEYVDIATGYVYPSITQVMKQAGIVDDRWFTDESRERGSAVHRLCTDYDLGALTDLAGCTSPYKAWLQAHAAAMAILRPEHLHVEEPFVNETLGIGGRPDRIWRLYGAVTTSEIKSGPPSKAHPIQTALQNLVAAPEIGLPAEAIRRGALYVQGNGKFTYQTHTDRRDFITARQIIRDHCGR